MIICIGSTSKPKVIAVCRAFSRFPELWLNDDRDSLRFVVLPKEGEKKAYKVDKVSKVTLNPTTLEETYTGARNRANEAYNYAKSAYGDCAFGVGLEAGIFPVSGTNSGYLDTSACVIYDGSHYYYGSSPMFEYPKTVTKRILAGEEAGLIADFFGNEAKGRGGVIGPLTKGRIMRDEFEELSVLMAMTQILREDLYSK